MAKRSKIVRNEKRRKLVDRYREVRVELKRKAIDPQLSVREREAAMARLRRLPRDSSATRIRNRCSLTGRARAYYRKFGLSRIALRELALKGELPGMIKASW